MRATRPCSGSKVGGSSSSSRHPRTAVRSQDAWQTGSRADRRTRTGRRYQRPRGRLRIRTDLRPSARLAISAKGHYRVISVDTSVVVRYLVGTPVAQARRARAVMEQGATVGLPVVVLLETAHVLRTQYGIDRRDVLDTLVELVTREDVMLMGVSRSHVLEALVRARVLPGSPLADALVVAMVRDADALPLYSFDRDMARHGIAVQSP